MSSIPKLPKDLLERIALYGGLLKAGYSKGEIASGWDFDSSEALFRQLRRDGFPVCEACGKYSKKPDHCGSPKRTRLATQTGEATPLPDISDADDLLRPVVDELAATVEDLDTRRELFRAGRFEQADVSSAPVQFFRSAYTDEQWRRLKDSLRDSMSEEEWKQFEENQDRDFYLRGMKTSNAVGATQIPRETVLIAAYVLSGRSIEDLLDRLHLGLSDDPRSVEPDAKLDAKVKQLKLVAGQVARLIRGGPVETGPSTGELTPEEQLWAWHAHSKRQAGVPDKEIRRELSEAGLPRDTVNRLLRMNLSPPD